MTNLNGEKPKYLIKVKEDGSTELINPELALELTQIAIQNNERPEYVWKSYNEFKKWIAEDLK